MAPCQSDEMAKRKEYHLAQGRGCPGDREACLKYCRFGLTPQVRFNALVGERAQAVCAGKDKNKLDVCKCGHLNMDDTIPEGFEILT